MQLLATTAWEQAKNAVGRLWRRAHPERVETMQAELEEARAEVLAARRDSDEQVEQALVGEWQGRLRRLVSADPQLAEELWRVVDQLGSCWLRSSPRRAPRSPCRPRRLAAAG